MQYPSPSQTVKKRNPYKSVNTCTDLDWALLILSVHPGFSVHITVVSCGKTLVLLFVSNCLLCCEGMSVGGSSEIICVCALECTRVLPTR